MPKRSEQYFRKKSDIILGPLPVNILNKVLGLELEEGSVVVTGATQKHAQKRHPNEYDILLPHLASIIRNPLYVGDDFKNQGKIEIIGKPKGLAQFALIALSIRRDQHGHYHVVSFYPVSAMKITNRKEKGFLHIVKN